MFDTPIHTNEQSIDRVLNAGLPVLLVFWQDRCPPCQQLEPVLERLARAYAGKALIAKVNALENPGLVQRYQITRLPGLVFAKDGRVEAKASGVASEDSLSAWLDYLIQGGARPALPTGPSVPFRASGEREMEAQTTTSTTYGAAQTSRQSQNSYTAETQARTGGKPIHLTDANFDQVVMRSELPVLVDFWAAWCGPCRMIAPVIEQLAREFDGRAVIGKLNVDENPRTAQRFGIRGIPTLLILHRGQVVDRIVGAQPASVIRQRLARYAH